MRFCCCCEQLLLCHISATAMRTIVNKCNNRHNQNCKTKEHLKNQPAIQIVTVTSGNYLTLNVEHVQRRGSKHGDRNVVFNAIRHDNNIARKIAGLLW